MDPLIYSSISNILSADKTHALKKLLTGVADDKQLNQLLDNTTIKRGCCMRKKTGDKATVKVKIPRPATYPIEVKGTVEDRFNYIEKIVTIDANVCDSKEYELYSPQSTDCNDFMQSYCQNVKEDYVSMLDKSKSFDQSEWSSYSPECSCYGQTAEESAPGVFTGLNVPPKCYMPSCGASTSYIDPKSSAGECNMTICNALFQASDLAAGNNISVQSKVEQNCGQQKKTETTTTDQGKTGTTSGSTTPSTTTTDQGKTTTTSGSTTPSTATTDTTKQVDTTKSSGSVGVYVGIGGGMIVAIILAILIYKMKK